MNLQELRTLNRIRNSDLKACEDLFHKHYTGMCCYAESLVKKEEVAEEVVQDVFLNIWKNRKNLKITSSWKSYLYRAVFNNAMMYIRKHKRETMLDENWATEQIISNDQPAEQYEEKELNALIFLTLQSLPDRTRQIFNMSRSDGMKYKEIARELSISIKTVEANMIKALKALRSTLGDYGKTA